MWISELVSYLYRVYDHVNPSSASPIYTRDLSFANTVPADALAPDGARASAGTVLATKFRFAGYHDFKSPYGHNMTSFKMADIISRNLTGLC